MANEDLELLLAKTVVTAEPLAAANLISTLLAHLMVSATPIKDITTEEDVEKRLLYAQSLVEKLIATGYAPLVLECKFRLEAFLEKNAMGLGDQSSPPATNGPKGEA